MERRDINLMDYFFLIFKARKFIFWNFIIVTILAAVISLLLPKYYKSVALMLPPQETKQAFGFSDVLASLPVTKLQLGSQGSPVDLAIGILKSETVVISIIDKFNLVKEYGVENRDQARAILKRLTEISLTKEGLVEVEVQASTPLGAADMANMYVSTLDSLKQVINQRKAKERADFIEQQIHENEEALRQAEVELKEFQLKTKAISPYQQQRVAIAVSAELELELMKQENTLKEYRSKSFSDSHPLVRELLNTIKFREDMLHNMRFGSSREERESLFVPLQDAPDLTLQYAKLTRRVEILGMLEQLLRQHYEESRIEQVNLTSTITILDRARPPQQKFRPKRKLIVLVAGAGSIFFSIVTILIIEFFNRLTEFTEENRRKVKQMARFLRINN
ncbi:GumC family protein [Candidatus Latescibacterota bacterium]